MSDQAHDPLRELRERIAHTVEDEIITAAITLDGIAPSPESVETNGRSEVDRDGVTYYWRGIPAIRLRVPDQIERLLEQRNRIEFQVDRLYLKERTNGPEGNRVIPGVASR